MNKLLLLSALIFSQTLIAQNVGIGTATPVARLHVTDSSVLFSSPGVIPATPGNTPISGAGRRMMWYPDKAAFRVGTVFGTEWDISNIGNYSFAAGYATTASGIISTAMGGNTIANREYSTAMGYATTASGAASTALGFSTTSKAVGSFSTGLFNDISDNPSPSATFPTDRIFQIGIGNSEATRSNAITVLKNGNTGIGATIPLARLHVTDSSVLFSATGDISGTPGSPPVSGAGRRMMWYPDKAAFRAGFVSGAEWNITNIGNYSFASGYRTTASGNYSVAMGQITTASGNYSTSFGSLTIASNDYSVAFGTATIASGRASTAAGFSTAAKAVGSFTTGLFNDITDSPSPTATFPTDRIFQIGNGNSEATRSNAITVLKNGNSGIGNTTPLARLHVTDSSVLFSATGDISGTPGSPPVSGAGRRMMWYPDKAAFRAGYIDGTQWNKDSVGNYSFACGYNSKAKGTGSTAMGFGNNTTGIFSAAIGAYNSSTEEGAFATGAGNTASGQYSIAMGAGTIASGNYSIATGINSTAGGYSSIALGAATNASGFSSIAMGNIAIASGLYSTAIGGSVTASGQGSLAMGSTTTASGFYSTALGYNTTASGSYSTALGINTTSSGGNSFSVGTGTNATGGVSVAMGSGSNAIGDNSTAIGLSTNAGGLVSTAMGNQTIASGNYSTAMGNQTIASGNYSTSLGESTKARSAFETVTGRWNTDYTPVSTNVWNAADRLFVIGNGTGPAAASSDAMTILKNGNTGFGTSAPGARLHVVSGASGYVGGNFPGITLEGSGNTYINILSPNSSETAVLFGKASDAAAGGIVYNNAGNLNSLDFRTNGNVTRMLIYGTGNAWLQGTLTQASDARLKKDISAIQNPLQKLIQLNGYTYHWKNEKSDNRLQTGVLAQEVQKLFPELVSENKEGILAVNYSGLIPVMIESIKEQQKQIDELRKQVQTLLNK
jgi:hypothetical protein